LDQAEEYTLLWPVEAAPVRLFCAVPLALALATLREVELGEDALKQGRAPFGVELKVMRDGIVTPRDGETFGNLVVRGADDADDWQREFYRWLQDNLRYPRDAADFGEQGLVGVRIFTAPDGTVRRVELSTASRSITLNHYSQSVFRGAKLPAFKRPTSNEIEIDLRIRYNLIRR
jgi:hypothetical protein